MFSYLVLAKYFQLTQKISWFPFLDDKCLHLVTYIASLKKLIFRLNDKALHFVVTCMVHAKDFLKEVKC
jgi:hypothetical protein